MADNPRSRGQPPDAPGWRGGGKTRAKAAPAAQHRWQDRKPDQQQRATARKALRHRLKLGGATLTLAALLAMFLYWVFFMPRPAPLIGVAVTRYQAPLPPNAWAQEDLQRFGGQADDAARRNLTLLPATPWHSKQQALEALRQRVRQAAPGGPGRNVILVYISAHGVIDDKGRACLVLPGDPSSSPGETDALAHLDPSRWLTVREIVAELDQQAKGKKKLLILDANRMHANWSIGLVYNGFADRLQQALEGTRDVVILNSTRGDQVGWSSAELASSPFGFFVGRGLRGYDDSDRDKNGRVSLRELHAYVESRVHDWVLKNRFDLQTPSLVPADAPDFDLVWTETERKDPAAEAQPARLKQDDANRLAQLWERHAQWRSPGGVSRAAWLQLHDFESRLLRLEQLLDAGAAYVLEAADELDALWAIDLGRRPGLAVAAHNLPLALAWRAAAADARQAAQHRRVIQAILDPSQNLAAVRDGDPVIRAAAAWEAVQNDPSPGTIRRALAAVGDAPSDGLEPVEQRFLRLLDPDGDLPATAWSQPPALIQSALHNRARAEQLAAPPDERVHYAVRPLVEAADADRRRAEDNLFVGGANELSEAASQASLAEAAYQQAAGRSARLARAYEVRDRAWWQLPYLAQWLAGRPEPDKTQLAQLAERDRQLATAYEAILANHALAERIERYVDDCLKSPDADNERDEQLDQAALLVERNLDALARLFQDRYAEVLRQAKDQRTLREIDALLSVPLVTGIQRRELRDTYREIAARASGYGEPVGTTKPAGAAAHLQLQRMLRWPQHPALAILDAPVRSGAQPVRSDPRQAAQADRDSAAVDVQAAIDQFARDAQAVRVRLAAANDIVSALASGPASRDRSTARPARAGLAQADSLVRAAAPLWGTSGIVAADPIAALFRFDLAELLLWQADRALEDFWGPAGGPSGKIPYFAAVAESYRKSARQLNPRDDDAWQRQGQLLARRQRAAREFLIAGTGDTRPVSEAAAIDKDVAVKVAGNLPRGKAALAVYDPAHAPVEVRAKQDKEFQPRFSVPIHGPATNASFALVLRPPGNTGAGSPPDANGPWQLAGLYRGHKSISHFHVLPLGRGLELVHRRQPKPTATVTVLGEAKNPGSLVFVLDCSATMQEPGQTNGRMNAARAAMIRIVQQLADVGGYKVSLWLYGHRVGVDGTGQPAWNTGWPNRIDLLPSDDVQQVASTEALDAASVQEFIGLLNDRNRVRPWGPPPLYRSIVDAINDLSREPKEFPRRLVLITDGVDNVTGPGDRWRPREGTLRTESDVARAFRDDHQGRMEDRIRLDVVGVAIDGAAQLEQFIERDPNIRGRYHPVTDLNLLLNEITKALGLYKFTLREAGPGGGRQFPERSLGESIEVDTREPGRREFDVRLVGADPPVHSGVAIEGGEALQLYLNRDLDLWRLVHRRYDREGETSDQCEGNVNPLARSSSDPFNPRQFYVAAHRPELLAGASVRFPISIQNGTAEEFSPRPAEAWVEIEPVFEPARDNVFAYPIYDLSFEDARSVPVLDCVVPDWPADARAARIRLWFKLTKTRPSKEAVIGAVVGLDDRTNPDLSIDGAPGVEFAVMTGPAGSDQEASEIRVIQRHPPGSAGLDSVKVEMLQPPDVARHEYFPQGQLVRHTFIYNGLSEADLQRYRLRITARAELERSAVQLVRPLVATLRRGE